MGFLNFRKKSVWMHTTATLRQDTAFGSSTGASAFVQIDTGLNAVKAFIPVIEGTATTVQRYFVTRISATDTGVVQVLQRNITNGASIAPATFRWVAFGDLG